MHNKPVISTSALLTGIVGYWTMNETGFTRTSSVGGTPSFQANGLGSPVGVLDAAGKIGNSASPTAGSNGGVDTWLRSNNGVADEDWNVFYTGADATISFWVRCSNFGGGNLRPIYASNTQSWGFRFQDNWNINYQISGITNATFGFGVGAVNNSWVHVVITKNAANSMNVYLNGQASVSNPIVVTPVSNEPRICYLQGQGIAFQIDELGLWNRVLNSLEIAELYNSGNGKTFPFP